MQTIEQIERDIERLKMKMELDIQAVECKHAQSEIGKYMQSNGQFRVRNFCSSCGQSLSADLKMTGLNLSQMRQFDTGYETSNRKQVNELKDSYRLEIFNLERKRDELKYKTKEVIESVLQDDEDFWSRYSAYLNSQAWHKMRSLVLQRDNHLCQACLSREATQVHHLSYRLFKEIGASAAFELVAICHRCHSKIHPHMADAQQEVIDSLRNPFLGEVTREK